MPYLATLLAGISLGVYFTRSYYLEREDRTVKYGLPARHTITADEVHARVDVSEGVRKLPSNVRQMRRRGSTWI